MYADLLYKEGAIGTRLWNWEITRYGFEFSTYEFWLGRRCGLPFVFAWPGLWALFVWDLFFSFCGSLSDAPLVFELQLCGNSPPILCNYYFWNYILNFPKEIFVLF